MKKTALFTLLFAGAVANAQQANPTNNSSKTDKETAYRSWSVGLNVGNSMFFGDLYSFEGRKQDFNSDFGGFDFGFSANVTKWINTYLGVQGQVGWQQFSGSFRDYGFEQTTIRPSLNFMINLSGAGGRNFDRPRKDSWVAHVGLGASFAGGEGFLQGERVFPIEGSGLPKFFAEESDNERHNSVFMPIGIEWRYRFAPSWDLSVGTQAILFFDNNFDGSQNFDDIADNPGSTLPRLSSRSNDMALYTHIGVNYYFGWKKGSKDKDVIVYNDPIAPIAARVSTLESNQKKLMSDKDGDGISDFFDKDNETPEGVAVDGSGRPLDVDMDGIPDYKDADPFSAPGAKVDAEGREIDSDGDGVPDSRDLEPNTPKGQLVNFQGKSIKLDAGAYYLPQVYFNFNSATVTAANRQRLVRIAELLKANPDWKMTVVGHTDKVGPESYNMRLSERRAKAVVKELANQFGIDESRLNAVGRGESEELAKDNSINRRVEFIIEK